MCIRDRPSPIPSVSSSQKNLPSPFNVCGAGGKKTRFEDRGGMILRTNCERESPAWLLRRPGIDAENVVTSISSQYSPVLSTCRMKSQENSSVYRKISALFKLLLYQSGELSSQNARSTAYRMKLFKIFPSISRCAYHHTSFSSRAKSLRGSFRMKTAWRNFQWSLTKAVSFLVILFREGFCILSQDVII